MDIYSVNIRDGLDGETFNKVLHYLNREQRDKIAKFTLPKDGLRSLIGIILAKKVISYRLHCKLQDVIFTKNEYGKPLLKDVENLHFNISHSEDWVVCAVDVDEIGADIEKIRHIDVVDISKRFFSSDEHQAIAACADRRRLDLFYELWTLKESYIKSRGTGLSTPLNTFSITIHNSNDVRIQTHETQQRRYSFKLYDTDSEYKLAVCSTGHPHQFPDDAIMIDLEYLCKTFLQAYQS